VAPDYLLVHRNVKEKFVGLLKESVTNMFYGKSGSAKDGDYARIINKRHVDRLKGYMTGAKTVLLGGDVDEEENFVAPTILDDVDLNSTLMTEEIFGPLLPVVTISSMDEALKFINDRPQPLALYLFSGDSGNQRRIAQETSSGALMFNDCTVHVANPHLPFGGVGPSGMGRYHGYEGFLEFSHRKSVMNRYCLMDPGFKYPPFSEKQVHLLRKLL
jgi:acyl-CoA reductase-like NAD-dependent aldehyde dehydrogenase